MAQLALATAGAVVGAATELPYGAQIGWTIGSLIGGAMVGGPSQQGPRLADLTVQISSYGAPIAKVWGTMGVAGNVVWAAPLIESESSQGGKGGPSYTAFSYAGSFAVLIGEGEIPGIRRIWLNAKLVYDVREDADEATIAASAEFANYFVFYQGTEDQLPDPTIESYEGAGNVEPMRGCAYIVFTNLPLGNYANQIPQVHMETISQEPVTTANTDLQPLLIYPWEIAIASDGSKYPRHSNDRRTSYQLHDVLDGGTVVAASEDYEEILAARDASYPDYTVFCGWNSLTQGILSLFDQPMDLVSGYGPVTTRVNYFCQQIDQTIWDGTSLPGGLTLCVYGMNPDDAQDWLVSSVQNHFAYNGHDMGMLTIAPFGVARFGYGDDRVIYANNCTNYSSVGGYYPTARLGNFLFVTAKRIPSVPPPTCGPGNPTALGIAELPGHPGFCISSAGEISQNVTYTEVSGSWLQLQKAAPNGSGPGSFVSEPGFGPTMLSSDPRNTMAFWTAAAAAAGVAGSYGSSYPVIVTEAAQATTTTISAATAPLVLGEIVADICRTAGLADDQFDVTELVDDVVGYARAKVMAARAAIEPLRQAYAFDAVESGDKIVFRKRGAAPVATIYLDDLGAGVDGALADQIDHQRDQESELPESVVVTYPAFAADYEPGAQQARRISSVSQQVMGVEMPVVLEDAAAADIAYTLLYDAWVGRTMRKVTLPIKWSKLEPTDVVVLDDGEFAYTVRVDNKSEQSGIATLECRDAQRLIYTDPAGQPGEVSGGGATVRVTLPANLMPLDIPIVRDIDDDGAGFYLAAGSFGGRWGGAHAYRSFDAGANFSFLDDLSVEATLGVAQTALGDFGGGNVVDEINVVRVALVSKTLSSITRAQLLNGENLCVLGGELLQFQRATLVSPRVYDLSGLLRGRFGTERHMGDHAEGDLFALLQTTAVRREAGAVAQIDLPAVMKGVSFGLSLDASYSIDFTNTGIGAKPLSPVHLAVTPIADGSRYQVSWVRRARAQPTWEDLTDIPLLETSEAYDVEVTDPVGSVLYTRRVTAPEAIVAAVGSRVLFNGVAAFVQIQDSTSSDFVSLTRSPYGQSLYIWDASTYAILGAAGLGASARANTLLAVGSDALYLATQDGTNPSGVKRYSKASIEATSLLTAAATYTASRAADVYGMAYDGTYVWTAENYSGQITKLDATTLAVIASYPMVARGIAYDAASSSHLFVNSGDRVTEVDPGTGGTVQEFVTGMSSSDPYPGDGALFVLGGLGVQVFDVSSGVLLTSYPSTAYNTFAGPMVWTAQGMAVACPATDEVLYLDDATGEELMRLPVDGVQDLAGYSVASGTLFVNVYASGLTLTYALVAASMPAGYLLNVYQISSVVGRGFPATHEF